MPSLPPQDRHPSGVSQPDGNEDNRDHTDHTGEEQDDGAPLSPEEEARRRAEQERIMMADLGVEVRDWITRSDGTHAPQVPLPELQMARAVNESGSEAEKAFKANKKEIEKWNGKLPSTPPSTWLTLHRANNDDGGAGDLNTMMDGQSHRARLREGVRGGGGQQYDLHGPLATARAHDAIRIPCRRGTAAGRGRGGGVIGTRGRGGAIPSGHPNIVRGAAYRPLDPAIEPDTEYGLGMRRGLRTGRAFHQDSQPPIRGIGSLGRGSIQNGAGQNVRGRMQDTAVPVTAASTQLPIARELLASRWAPAALAVNPLPPTEATPPIPAEAVANLSHREENASVQEPVLTPEPEAQPEAEGMRMEEMSPAGATPTIPEVQDSQIAELIPGQEEERGQVEREPTRQVPAYGPGFSPSTSNHTTSLMDIDDRPADLPSPGMSYFAGSPDHGAAVGQVNLNAEDNFGTTHQPYPAASGAVVRELFPGTGDQSVLLSAQGADMEEDLLALDDEQVNLGNGASADQAVQSPGAFADLAGLAFDDIGGPHGHSPTNVPEQNEESEAVTNAEEHPEHVVIGGLIYYRADRHPHTVTPSADTDDAPTVVPTLAPTDRLATDTGSNVGVSDLSPETDDLLGERNLARREQEMPATLSSTSIWAEVPVQSGGVRRQRRDSPVRVPSEPVLATSQRSNLTIDSRPPAIGERNLPGRSDQATARGLPVGTSARSSGTDGRGPQQPARRPSALRREANPWTARRATDATAMRSDNTVDSQRGEGLEEASTKSSQGTTDGHRNIGVFNRSSGTTLLSTRAVLSPPEATSSPLFRNASSTSGGGTISSAAGSSKPKPETDKEKMMRVNNSKPDHSVAQPRPAGSSVSSTGNAVGSLRSPSTTSKPTPTLGDSRWAVPGARSSSSTTTNPHSAKPAGQHCLALNPIGSNANMMRSPGGNKKRTERTNAGPSPGLAWMLANHDIGGTAATHAMGRTMSNTPAAASALAIHSSVLPVTSVAQTTPTTVPDPINQTTPYRTEVATSWGRLRDESASSSPGGLQQPLTPAARPGNPEMMYRDNIVEDSDDSDSESEL